MRRMTDREKCRRQGRKGRSMSLQAGRWKVHCNERDIEQGLLGAGGCSSDMSQPLSSSSLSLHRTHHGTDRFASLSQDFPTPFTLSIPADALLRVCGQLPITLSTSLTAAALSCPTPSVSSDRLQPFWHATSSRPPERRTPDLPCCRDPPHRLEQRQGWTGGANGRVAKRKSEEQQTLFSKRATCGILAF